MADLLVRQTVRLTTANWKVTIPIFGSFSVGSAGGGSKCEHLTKDVLGIGNS